MDFIRQLDFSTLNFMEQIRTPFLTLFFKAITVMGEWSFVLGVLVLTSIFFIIKKKFRYDIAVWLATAGGMGTAFALKEIFHRSRPIGALVAETSSSFPSAHAVTSIAFYAFIFYLLARNANSRFPRYLLITIMFLVPVFLGLSRLYLGVHYLSDVLAGYAIGDIWFLIGVYLLNKTSRSPLAARGDLDVFNK